MTTASLEVTGVAPPLEPLFAAGADAVGTSGGSSASSSIPTVTLRSVTPAGCATPQATLVIVNAALPAHSHAHFVAALFQFLVSSHRSAAAGGGGPSLQIHVVAAALLNGPDGIKGAGAVTILKNDVDVSPSIARLPQLPGAAKIRDSLLATALHVAVATGQPLSCLLVPGHKPPATSDLRESLPEVARLAGLVTQAAGGTLLKYDEGAGGALRLSHKWLSDARDAGRDVNMYT